MEIIRNVRMMRQTASALRGGEKTIGFVPTMGALHEGHLSLVKRAREENDITVVSIFVNPTQFGPGEDLEKYPRDIEGDMEKLEAEGVDILFLPEAVDIYPEGYSTYVNVEGITEGLCGRFREGHFRGVATVVTKLFNIVRPTTAYFGQKDYQQSLVIKRLVRDLNFDIDIVVCPTVREPDGLAMSSRNQYLNEEERQAATVIFKTLTLGVNLLKDGKSPKEVHDAMWEEMRKEPLVREIEYLSVYHPESLTDLAEVPADQGRQSAYLLAAAVRIGSARLIDNILVEDI
ncbi:MAG: pantoate--beta-alanine ligase [Nitrospirae bacterium]|nr:MAG: pantoate--beta-alanine ligase [Nitrospirota bacterium]